MKTMYHDPNNRAGINLSPGQNRIFDQFAKQFIKFYGTCGNMLTVSLDEKSMNTEFVIHCGHDPVPGDRLDYFSNIKGLHFYVILNKLQELMQKSSSTKGILFISTNNPVIVVAMDLARKTLQIFDCNAQGADLNQYANYLVQTNLATVVFDIRDAARLLKLTFVEPYHGGNQINTTVIYPVGDCSYWAHYFVFDFFSSSEKSSTFEERYAQFTRSTREELIVKFVKSITFLSKI